MNNTKQTYVYYEYQICTGDNDLDSFWLGDEKSLIEKTIEYKNSRSFNTRDYYNMVEIVQWKLDRNFQSFHQGEYHPEYFEIYPIFGRDLKYSSLKYENLPKYIQKKLDIIKKAIA